MKKIKPAFKFSIFIFLCALVYPFLKHIFYEMILFFFDSPILFFILFLLFWIFFPIFWIISVFSSLQYLRQKDNFFFKRFAPLALNLLVLISPYLPLSEETYYKLNYKFLKASREKVAVDIFNQDSEVYGNLTYASEKISSLRFGYVSVANRVSISLIQKDQRFIYFPIYSSFLEFEGVVFVPEGQNCKNISYMNTHRIDKITQYSDQWCHIHYSETLFGGVG